MSSLSADQKVNMSLDDIVKHKAAEAKKAPAKKQDNKKKSPPAKNGNQQQKKVNAPSAKVAQSVGAAKAKRGANINQRRGLSQTGKATKAAVKAEISKASQPKRTPRPTSAGGASLAKVGQLKISFKPKELNKTTEKAVAQQIRAVLAKIPTPRGNGGSVNGNNQSNSNRSTPRPNSGNKRNVRPNSAASGSSKGQGRGNPKRRGAAQR